MRDVDFYTQVLGLESPWRVSQVDLNISACTVLIYIDYDRAVTVWCCPECQQPAPLYDHLPARQWRHLDTCQMQTFIVASLPRTDCPIHGKRSVTANWSNRNSRFTLLFERFALDMLFATNVQKQAAKMLRISDGQMHAIMFRGVARGLSRRDSEECRPHISVDEKGFKKGHQYVSVLSDPCEKLVIDIVEGRTLEATMKLLKGSLSSKQRSEVKSISMDMWPAFQTAASRELLNAVIVHDRFHISKYLNEAVDLTRRTEQKRLLKQNDKSLSRSKYLFLCAPENLSTQRREAFEKLQNLDLETSKVYAFKESFRDFFNNHTKWGAEQFFNKWYDAAIALENVYLTKVAKMLKNHLTGLLAYIMHRVSNGHAEGINGRIQLIKANARGYRKFENFRGAVLFFLGKMDVYPHKSS